jgi:hypothetical protein
VECLLHGADSPPIKAPDIPQTASKVSQSQIWEPIDTRWICGCRSHSGSLWDHSPSAASGRLDARRPKKRGPFHLVPVIAKAISDKLAKVLPAWVKPSAVTVTR